MYRFEMLKVIRKSRMKSPFEYSSKYQPSTVPPNVRLKKINNCLLHQLRVAETKFLGHINERKWFDLSVIVSPMTFQEWNLEKKTNVNRNSNGYR